MLPRGGSATVTRLRRFGQRVLGLGERPIEPRRQYLDVGGLDGRTTPDAQAWRRVAVVGEVVAGALLLDRGGERLGKSRLGVGGKRRHGGIDDLETDRRV